MAQDLALLLNIQLTLEAEYLCLWSIEPDLTGDIFHVIQYIAERNCCLSVLFSHTR